ncbi:MAG: class II glutamine amidotransferase [Elusimicrobiota bacterium]|nr:class II glutamine amidotransferase [Elusimicrobiota bacterium]
MCAITGWHRPDFPARCDRETLLRHLIRKAQPFGDKSFGLATDLPGKDALVKYVGMPSQWLAQNSRDIGRFAKAQTLIAHARYPTQGDVVRRNCHPFKVGDWLMAHNGTLRAERLMLRSSFVPAGETDSEAAGCWLATHGFSTASLEELEGTFAIAAMSKDGAQFVLAVDEVTSLFVARIGEGILWHKSGEALESSLRAVGIQAEVQALRSQVLRFPGGRGERLDRSSNLFGARHDA